VKSAIELRAERHAISLEMGKLIDIDTPDSRAKFKELDRAQEKLAAQIEDAESRKSRFALPNVGRSSEELNPREQMRSSEEYRRAANHYMRTGEMGELRALNSVSGDGSTLVPTGFQREVEIYRKAIGGPRLVSRVVTTSSGNTLPWPTEQDTSNAGVWLAESAATSEVDPTFSNVTLYADLISSGTVLTPVELLQDSAFSMEATLAESFGLRLARGQAAAFTTGNGLQTPGLVTELVSAGGRNVLAVGGNNNSGNDADTDINSIGTDDFSNLITAVDKAYRTGDRVYFMGNQSAFDKVRTLKDKYGRPIWQTSLSEGAGDTIDGYPWIHNQAMAGIGAGNISMIFGNFSKYIIRDVLGMTMIRYNELFMQNRQIGYEMYARTFGKLLNPTAFSYLIHPDS
jgi:HK97 family phage major capsid protein